MTNEEYLENEMDHFGVPEHMRGAVKRYLLERIEPGSFLRAVLENNLSEAFGRADDINEKHMKNWVLFVYNIMPRTSWGSPEVVQAWLEEA